MATQIWVKIGSGNGRINVDSPSKVLCGIRLTAITQQILGNLIRKMCLEIIFLKLLQYLPGSIELRYISRDMNIGNMSGCSTNYPQVLNGIPKYLQHTPPGITNYEKK